MAVAIGFLVTFASFKAVRYGAFLVVKVAVGFATVAVGQPVQSLSAVKIKLFQKSFVLESQMTGALFVQRDAEMLCRELCKTLFLRSFKTSSHIFPMLGMRIAVHAPAVKVIHSLFDVGELSLHFISAKLIPVIIKGVKRDNDFLVAPERFIGLPAVVVVDIFGILGKAKAVGEVVPDFHYRGVDGAEKVSGQVGFELKDIALVEFVFFHFAEFA